MKAVCAENYLSFLCTATKQDILRRIAAVSSYQQIMYQSISTAGNSQRHSSESSSAEFNPFGLNRTLNSLRDETFMCCRSDFCNPQQEYRSTTKRRVALTLILVCHVFTWLGGSSLAVWLPRLVQT